MRSRSPVEPPGFESGRVESRSSRARRFVRPLLFVAGLALLFAVFRSVGWRAIAANVSRAGPWFLFLVAIYAVAQVAFTLGWRAVLDPVPPLSRFPRLFGVYLSGDAANSLAPGNVAGEPLKVHLLREGAGGAAALASVTVHKHADLVAQWIFVAIGVGVALTRFSLPLAARVVALATTAGLGALVVWMTRALRRGTYSPVLTRLARIPTLARRPPCHSPGAIPR